MILRNQAIDYSERIGERKVVGQRKALGAKTGENAERLERKAVGAINNRRDRRIAWRAVC